MNYQVLWLNVDKPLKSQILHYEKGCPDVQLIGVGKYKPVGKLGRDGGWLSFSNVASAVADAKSRVPKFEHLRACSNCSRDEQFTALVGAESDLLQGEMPLKSPNYFWVNQGQTYEEERELGIIWAPQKNSLGRPLSHWEEILNVRPDDVIFSYANQMLVAVSTAMVAGYAVDYKPVTNGQWANGPGYQADLAYVTPPRQRPKSELLELGFFQENLGKHLVAANGSVKQAYLFRLDTTEGQFLMSAVDLAIPNDSGKIDERLAGPTQRAQLVQARIGQGKFREEAMRVWNDRCALSDISHSRLLRASHIKPWSESTNLERLDPYNGIILSANLDAAFDCGLISFEDDGTIKVSEKLSEHDRMALGLDILKVPEFTAKHVSYLAYHRLKFGFSTK
jgi:putative restriction endonuclease